MLWAWFEEDDILARMGKPRLHTDEQQNFLYPYLWDVLIERIDLEFQKKSRDLPEFPMTLFRTYSSSPLAKWPTTSA